MSDRLTFSWFVGTCNLGHPATGPQEALWNTVNSVLLTEIRTSSFCAKQNSAGRETLYRVRKPVAFLSSC